MIIKPINQKIKLKVTLKPW